MYRHLLVPLDDTELSVETVSHAVQFARTLGARITFFHAQEEAVWSHFGQAEVARVALPVDADYAPAGRAHELLARAEAAARAWGVPCSSRAGSRISAHEGIIRTAHECGCDLVFMASHGRRSRLGMVLGSQTLKVLTGVGLPVLVRSVSEPAALPAALDILRAEHRSLAAVLHAASHLVEAAQRDGRAPDMSALRAVLHYLRTFPVALHHPKEEALLFRALRERTSVMDAELDELERQHARDRELVGQLEALADCCAGGEPAALTELAQALARYLAFTWEHLGREEGVVQPAALHHLQAEDWARIEAGFAANRDPAFDADPDLERLRAHILEVAARAG